MKNEITSQRAEWYKLPPQGAEESDEAFRRRIAGALRDKGNFIEAQEALQNGLYDAKPEQEGAPSAMDGIYGAVAAAFHKTDYGAAGVQQCENELIAGAYLREKRKQPAMSPEMALIAMMLGGRP